MMTPDNSSSRIVLVTGATGFVGRFLCEKLLTVFDLVRGAVWVAEAETNLPAGVQTTLVETIGPATDWSEALAGVDTVIHLAARVHVMDDTSQESLEAYRRVNVAGTENLARQATAFGVRRMVFVSTVKVHGEEADVPYTEEDDLFPQNPYGVSKLEAEMILRQVAEETALEVVIVRPPLIYGPGVKANFLRLLGVVEKGVPLPFASIENRRSFVYLGNLVDAISLCAVHPKASNQTFLVSDGEDVSTPDLIRRLATALRRPARLIPFPPILLRISSWLLGKTNAVDRLLGSLMVDISKIRRELDWHPPYTMVEGLKKTAAWYKDKPATADRLIE